MEKFQLELIKSVLWLKAYHRELIQTDRIDTAKFLEEFLEEINKVLHDEKS